MRRNIQDAIERVRSHAAFCKSINANPEGVWSQAETLADEVERLHKRMAEVRNYTTPRDEVWRLVPFHGEVAESEVIELMLADGWTEQQAKAGIVAACAGRLITRYDGKLICCRSF